jgi:multisubunit Na+/H+ antiporter MnhF subunit
MDRGPTCPARTCTLDRVSGETESVLRTPVPGPLYELVKRASYIELTLFAALIVVWVAPGMQSATAVLGLAHGLGFVALALFIWYAAIRHEAPYTLLAATLTPVGPVGSVIAIHYIDRKYGDSEAAG